MGVAVHLEPFLFGASRQIAFEIAAGVQPHAAPIGGREQRCLDLRKIGGARGVIIIAELVSLCFARRVGAIAGEFRSRDRLRASHCFTRHRTFGAAVAETVLHAADLARMPAVENAT